MLFIPEDDVVPSAMSVEQGLKTLISAGSVAPSEVNFAKKSTEEKKK